MEDIKPFHQHSTPTSLSRSPKSRLVTHSWNVMDSTNSWTDWTTYKHLSNAHPRWSSLVAHTQDSHQHRYCYEVQHCTTTTKASNRSLSLPQCLVTHSKHASPNSIVVLVTTRTLASVCVTAMEASVHHLMDGTLMQLVTFCQTSMKAASKYCIETRSKCFILKWSMVRKMATQSIEKTFTTIQMGTCIHLLECEVMQSSYTDKSKRIQRNEYS